MAFVDIRQEFIEGVQEIFSTLFNNHSENEDGCFLYLLSDQRETNVYGEKKYKTYQAPKRLICKATLNPTYGQPFVEEIKDDAEFVIPLKSLQLANIGVSNSDLEEIRRGYLKFHGVFYTIDNIIPKAFVEDVFLMYRFLCTENKHEEKIVIHYEEGVFEEDVAVAINSEYDQEISEFFSASTSVSMQDASEEKVADEYSVNKDITSDSEIDSKMGMFTNVDESTFNDSDIQIPDTVDVITENGVQRTAYPAKNKYVGG